MDSDLSQFSEEQLLAEIGRRKNKNKWYYIVGGPDNWSSNTNQEFLIVHKRFWHLHHTIDDNHISDLVALPEEFDEAMESTFEYDGSAEKGECLLKDYGFTKLANPFWAALTVYVPILGLGWPRLDITSDTPKIKTMIEEWVQKALPARSNNLPADWSKDNYLGRLSSFSQNNGLVHVVTSDYGSHKDRWEGAGISVLARELFESLPKYELE